MAVAQGSGTGGTTEKKKYDTPLVKLTNDTGTSPRQATGTSSSTGFKDKQTTADPYFSNTSPAGSTMSSDKSTWRSTNSGWNVPPSGGTAAQGGGTYNREAAAQSRSGSTVRDSNRDRSTTGDRASINTTISRDRGQEIQAPQLQGYDSPLVRLTGEAATKERWTPSTARSAEAEVQFSSPLWNWAADKAERGVGYLEQVQQDYKNSGIKRAHDERAADREAWYEEQISRGGWRAAGATIAAPILGLFQATEMAQDAMLATQMPEAPADWQAREVASIMGRPAPNIPEQVSVGQALSAAGEATNKKFNVFSSDFEGPLPQYSQSSQYSTLPLPAQEYSGDWYSIFSQSIEDSRSVNERYQSLSPQDQFLASPVYNMLHSSGPQAQEAALTTVLTQAETVQNYQQQADAARSRGDMLKAASYAMAAESLKAKTPLDIVEENKVWSGDLMAKIIVPDPLDIAIGPAVEATQASVARVRAMLASPMTEATVEVATQALQTALEGADELAKVADASGDLFRFWAGKKNAVQKLFENTRATEAERVAANFSDSLAVVLPRAQTADEAKVIITDLLNGTLFEKNPDIGRNPFLDPQFLTDLPIIKQAEDLLLNAKTLNDPEGYNPLLVLGELEDKIWRKSRQLFGLDNADLPTGTVRMKTVKDGEKYVVQWLGADDTVLRASDKLDYKAAKALANEQDGFIQEGLSKPWFLRVGDWQRAVLSTMYLNLAPRHWIRNAIAAYSAMGVDDALNITKLDNMSDHVLQLYGGGAPSTEWGGVLRGMGQNPVAPETGTKGFWTFGGRWKKGNPIAWVDNLGNKIWTSTTEVPIGNGQAIPVGEEAFRLRIAYGKMMEYLNHGVDVMLEDFASGMRDLGIAPEVVSSYAGQFSDLARRTNRTEIFEQMRQAIGSPELAASLEEIGIDATRTTPQGRASLMQILNESSLNDLGTLEGRLLGWLKQETQGVSEILSQVPPQPGRQFFTAMDMAQDAADGIETLTYAAVKGGMDPGEARIAAETLWRGVIDNEKQAMQAVQDLISNTNGTDAFDRAFLFFQKIEDEKRNIRLAVDRLNRNAARSAREGANIWAETQAQVSKLWGDYASNVQTWLDDISNATVATRAAQPLGVGEIVRLTDGTEVTVKQVLQENDVTSYVVTPRAQQATAQAAHQAPVQSIEDAIAPHRKKSISVQLVKDSNDVTTDGTFSRITFQRPRVTGDYLQDYNSRIATDRIISISDENGNIIWQAQQATAKAGFTTEQGSTYAWNGTSSVRNKAQRVGADPGDFGPKPQSDYTVFVDPKDSARIGDALYTTKPVKGTTRNYKFQSIEVTGTEGNEVITFRFADPQGEAKPLIYQAPVSRTPQVGLQPLEVWDQGQLGGHLGNKITDVSQQAAPAPAFVERTVNASDIVVPANATGRAQSMTDDLLQKYLAFDAQDNARLREMGVSSSSDDVTWSKVINAGREYVDNALNDALLFFRRSPSQEFFDHLVSAEKEVNETGMWVAAQVSRIRDQWFNGTIDRAAYYEQSSRWWNEFFEFGHQRFRFATNAGLRATLGEDAVNALAAVPTYHVPPTPEIDDIRRMAALVGRATDKGDRRLVNSINSHLNTSVKRLEELTPDQRRAAFQFYMQEAQTTGVDIPSEWYRWRNPNTSMVTGFGEGDNFAETMWKLESGRVVTGNVQTPTYGEVARYELSNSWDVVRRVLDNAERLLTPRVNNLDNQQKAGTIRLLNNMLRKWEDTLYNAAKAGEEATAFAMLNYRDRKNIDTFLSAIFPYHYYATRAPLNWLRRTIERPSIAYNVWLANQAIRGENQQFDGPMRAEGSIPNPFVNLASNIGAQGVADALPSRIYSPLEYAIPYSIWNDFINPEEGQTRLERAYLNVQKFTPGFQPIIQGLGATIFDAVSPRTDDWSRLSDYQLGDYLPLGRMAGYLAQGISGNQIWGQLGDKFDFGRIGRSIRNGIAAGDYDSYYGNLALGQIENQMRGYTPIPELQDPKTAAEVQKIVEGGIKAAGWERFMNLAMGYFTGFPGQDVSAIEKELRDYQQEYYGLGYGYENTMGSRAAQDAFKENPLSSGVPYGEGNAYYSDLYGPVGSEYGPKAVQAVTKQFNQERSAIYDEMGKATVDFLLDNPTATKGELNEFKQQYYTQVDALKEKYPSADTEGDARYAVNGNGMNPFERAQTELENVLRYEPPGKPEYPGDGASPKVMDDYYTALGEWKEKRLNVVERVFEQWAQGDDTQPGAADADYVGQRTVMGRYAQELVDTYELRFADPVEIEWAMRNQLRSEAVSSSYAAQKQTLTEQFGEDGYALFRAFQLIPEGENGDYWTDAHDKFIEEHPEVQEMMIYDRSPEVHDHMVSMGGDRVFEALAMYPGGGTKSQKNQWKSRYGREKEAVYWYFGVNDRLQSSTSGAYAEGDRLATDWMNYTGPRPVGSDRQPIGGITRAEYQHGADPYFQNDYTGMRPQDAIAAGQQVAAINTPTQGVMSRSDLQGVIDRAQQPPNRGVPGLTAPPAGSAAELQAAKVAADAGRLMEYLDAVKQAQSEEDAPRQQFASGYGYGGYYYRGRYYRRRSYRRRSSRRRSGGYRRYSRGGRRGGGYGGGYGGGGGGGYSTAEEQQPLYLRFDGPPQTYARDFATWLYPQSNNQTWRPTGINSGFTPPRGNVAIRPWRRINVRA